jgi:hypothetical protein
MVSPTVLLIVLIRVIELNLVGLALVLLHRLPSGHFIFFVFGILFCFFFPVKKTLPLHKDLLSQFGVKMHPCKASIGVAPKHSLELL